LEIAPFFHRRLGLGEKRPLDEVEIIEQPDPSDAGKEVQPTQKEHNAFGG
jgi:hypothetical protein